jgi:predicted AAA+ superfamily ATPase
LNLDLLLKALPDFAHVFAAFGSGIATPASRLRQALRALDPLQRRLHFWRDRPGHEVDFVLEQNGKLVALEIKSGSTVTSSDASGIRAFRDSLNKTQILVRSVVLHAGREGRPLDTGILALPWGWMVPAE